MNQTVTFKAPIKVKDFNGKNYYLILEDADRVTHFFHKKLPKSKGKVNGKLVVYSATKQGEYDGWSALCNNPKSKELLKKIKNNEKQIKK